MLTQKPNLSKEEEFDIQKENIAEKGQTIEGQDSEEVKIAKAKFATLEPKYGKQWFIAKQRGLFKVYVDSETLASKQQPLTLHEIDLRSKFF